jgi:hypothetical protein
MVDRYARYSITSQGDAADEMGLRRKKGKRKRKKTKK